MRTIYHFTYLLLCFVLVACASTTPQSTEVITPENAHQVTQLDRRPGFLERNRGSITNVSFSPYGDILAAGYSEGSLRLYDVMTLKLLAELTTQFNGINDVAFSSDGKLIAAGGGNYASIEIGIQIWDVATQEQRLLLGDFNDPVYSLAFSPDGTLLAIGEGGGMGVPGSVKIWNVATGELLDKFGQIMVRDVAFNPDGTLLAAANYSGEVLLWDVVNKQEKAVLNGYVMFGVTFSPDGTILATSGYLDETYSTAVIRLWDVATGELLLTLIGNTASITNITFHPDGRILASASSDGSVWLWDVKTGEVLAVLDITNASSVAFSPDGTLLATDGDIVRLWGVPTH